jgi:Holliday junction resolvasome RuvABC DNA-binding subunit
MAERGWFKNSEFSPDQWMELLNNYLRVYYEDQDSDDMDRVYRGQEAQALTRLFNDYANGEATVDDLVAFEIDFLSDVDGVTEWWDQTVSIAETDRIIETLETNPSDLANIPAPTGTKTNEYLETTAMSFVGTTPTSPITTVGGPSGQTIVIRGGTGVTMSIPQVLESGSIKDLLGVMVPYIPGVSLPNWLPTAGVIFLPTIKDAVEKVEEIITEVDISGAWEEGDIGEVIRDIGEIVVGAGTAAADVIEEKVKEVIGGVVGGVTDPTQAGAVLGGVLAGSFPSGIPDWLGGILSENVGRAVYGAARNVLVNSGTATEEQLPLTQETPEQDPALMFTHRGDNYFVNSESNEYFQLEEDAELEFDVDGLYSRADLEETGLETLESGTYQSLLDDYSFYALTEDIYQYPIKELVKRFEEEGGIMPGDFNLMDDESQYDFFINEFFNPTPTRQAPIVTDPEPEPEPAPQPEPEPAPQPEPEPESDAPITEEIFSDILGETEANILQGIADFGFTTPEDIVNAINEAGLLTPENLATTLAAAGFATPEDIGTALANSGFATPQDISDALSAAGFATPEDLATALSNAGYATPEDLVTALSETGFATPEDIATALTNAGLVTPQDLADAFDAAGLATPQDVIDAISAAGLATPQDIVDALDAFGFTEAQLEQIAGALPEGLTTDQLNTALNDALAGIATGTDLDTATTTITDAISGLGFATAEDVRTALEEFGFTDAQLEQIVEALPEGISASDLSTALEGIVVGADLDTAVTTITDAISGLSFATAEDVRTALSEFGFTDAQLEQIVNALPEGLSLTDVEGALSTALTGIATGEDLTNAVTTITDAFSNLDVASAQDVRDALSQFNFSEEQLNQIVNALPEGLSTEDLATALENVVVGADLDTAVTTITDAIGGLDIASAQDVRDALAEFNFTEDQLNQIINALPEGLSTDDLTTALSDVVVGDDLTAAVTTITDAIGGLDIASPDDVRNILSNYGFTDAQLQQIVGALPEGLSLADVTGALETAMSGIALGTDIDSATNTITDAISGLAFATPEDVANALTQFGFTEDQLNQIASVIPEGLSISDLNDALGSALSGIALGSDLETATTTITDAIGGLNFATADDVANALANFGFSEDQLNQIAGVIPEGLSLNDLNNALGNALSGIALGTDLDTATSTITDAIGGLSFATAQDVQDALTAFNFTESQLNQISGLLPDNLTQTQVQDLLTTSLSGVSTQENVDEAFATLTTNLTANLGELAEGQEEILTGQEGLFGGQQDILTGVGEESQRLEDIIMSSTGLLAAIGAGGLGGAPARPRPEPYRPYMEKLDYAPGMVEALKPQQQVDYNKEVDRLLTMGMGGRKQGMLV